MSISTITNKDNLVVIPNDPSDAYQIGYAIGYQDGKCDAPTIDAVPVVHGEWKPFDLTYGRSIYSCSVCEQATEVPMCMEKPMYAYCPNCGARMGEERRDG